MPTNPTLPDVLEIFTRLKAGLALPPLSPIVAPIAAAMRDIAPLVDDFPDIDEVMPADAFADLARSVDDPLTVRRLARSWFALVERAVPPAIAPTTYTLLQDVADFASAVADWETSRGSLREAVAWLLLARTWQWRSMEEARRLFDDEDEDLDCYYDYRDAYARSVCDHAFLTGEFELAEGLIRSLPELDEADDPAACADLEWALGRAEQAFLLRSACEHSLPENLGLLALDLPESARSGLSESALGGVTPRQFASACLVRAPRLPADHTSAVGRANRARLRLLQLRLQDDQEARADGTRELADLLQHEGYDHLLVAQYRRWLGLPLCDLDLPPRILDRHPHSHP